MNHLLLLLLKNEMLMFLSSAEIEDFGQLIEEAKSSVSDAANPSESAKTVANETKQFWKKEAENFSTKQAEITTFVTIDRRLTQKERTKSLHDRNFSGFAILKGLNCPRRLCEAIVYIQILSISEANSIALTKDIRLDMLKELQEGEAVAGPTLQVLSSALPARSIAILYSAILQEH
jgi:hypothetical protein